MMAFNQKLLGRTMGSCFRNVKLIDVALIVPKRPWNSPATHGAAPGRMFEGGSLRKKEVEMVASRRFSTWNIIPATEKPKRHLPTSYPVSHGNTLPIPWHNHSVSKPVLVPYDELSEMGMLKIYFQGTSSVARGESGQHCRRCHMLSKCHLPLKPFQAATVLHRRRHLVRWAPVFCCHSPEWLQQLVGGASYTLCCGAFRT